MDQWQERKRPVCLERRYEFDSYDATRDFLDRLGDHSEATQRFPDISFGRTYVNITLRPEEDGGVLNDADRVFAAEIDALV
tara:strand:- start:6834 stop:7076 length:243 start_codon:yes stop_codon:yes gene_type:complete